MLKVPEREPRDAPDRPFGELIHQLVEDAKTYVRAEAELLKAIAAAKLSELILPAALLVAALFLAMAAFNGLAVGVVLALTKFVGPLLSGLIGMLVFLALAGGLTWLAINKIRKVL